MHIKLKRFAPGHFHSTKERFEDDGILKMNMFMKSSLKKVCVVNIFNYYYIFSFSLPG